MLLIIVASFVGLTVSAKSLQIGKAVPVIAMTTVAANALTILSGPIVFGDPVPDDALGFTARILAFVLVLGAAALTPAPVRAARGVDRIHDFAAQGGEIMDSSRRRASALVVDLVPAGVDVPVVGLGAVVREAAAEVLAGGALALREPLAPVAVLPGLLAGAGVRR